MSVTQLISAISADVVARLAAANMQPLVDGAVLLGPQHVWENSSPPRIVFIPTISSFLDEAPSAGVAPNGSYETSISTPWIWQENKRFHVMVWNCVFASGVCAPDPDGDWDATEALYRLLIQSLWALAGGAHKISGAFWRDARPDSPRITALGRMFEFDLDIFTTVPKDTAPLPFVPPGTIGEITVGYSGAASGDDIVIRNVGG